MYCLCIYSTMYNIIFLQRTNKTKQKYFVFGFTLSCHQYLGKIKEVSTFRVPWFLLS